MPCICLGLGNEVKTICHLADNMPSITLVVAHNVVVDITYILFRPGGY